MFPPSLCFRCLTRWVWGSQVLSVFSLLLCCSYYLKLLGVRAAQKHVTHKGLQSLILAWMWALRSCLLHKERGKEQIQSCKAPLHTNAQSLCPSKPLCIFYAPSSNIVHCYGLSVLLQVLLICLLSLLCSFLKGNKSNWWGEATEKSLTRNTSTTLPTPAALTNCLFPCSE